MSVVLYSVDDGVAVITLNRPERLNAWTAELGAQYFAALDRAEQDPDVAVIVVTGAGKGFCAGADMDLLQGIGSSVTSDDDTPAASGPGHQHTHALTMVKPVIGAINGAAAGLGLAHALACDLRFAADTAKFTTAFAKRGLIAEHGLSWTLPRLVGPAIALDLLLSSRVVLADEAKELGLVNQVVPADELLSYTLTYAKELARNCSPTSMAVMKYQTYAHPQMSIDDALAESIDLMEASLRRSDFPEGVASFVERREPKFSPVDPSAVPPR